MRLSQFLKPTQSSVVDCLCNVIAKIEATVVASAKDQDELSWFMLHFGDFELRILLFEGVGIYQGSFVPKMFAAFAKMLGEVVFCFFFKDATLFSRNTIPKFRFSLV